MNKRALLSFPFLVAASAATLLSAGARADLVPDEQAHRACIERIEAVSHRQGLAFKGGDTYAAPQESADRYRYYLNLKTRGDNPQAYRAECEARRTGKVTYFALEPGRWLYQSEPASTVASL